MSTLKYYKDSAWHSANGKITGDTLPIGAIIPFGGSNAPTGWLICDGSLVSRTTYSDLFNAIGTTWGSGDGSTTFALPDLKGRVLVGQDSSQTEFDTLGETGGEKTHTLTTSEMPSHNHSKVLVTGTTLTVNSSGGSDAMNIAGGASGAKSTVNNLYTSSTGGGEAHNNLQPYAVGNYIIKASQTAGLVGSVVNTESTSTSDTYSCDYINGTTLYENSSGSNGDITLSEDISNYKYLEIYYTQAASGTILNSKKVDCSLSKQIPLAIINADSSGSMYINTRTVEISGTSISTYGSNRYSKVLLDVAKTAYSISKTNSIYIVKVIGYK